MALAFKLASRYLRGRKLRTILTLIAVSFAVMLVVGLNAILPAMTNALRANLLAAAGAVDLQVTSVTSDTFSQDLVGRVRGIDGIEAATGILQRPAVLGPGAPVPTVIVTGIDPRTATRVRPFRMLSGRFLQLGDAEGMVITRSFAETAKLRVGSTFEVPGSTGSATFKIVGILDTRGAPGAEQVYVILPAAQRLFFQGGRIDLIEAAFSPGVDRATVENHVKRTLGPQFRIGGLSGSDQLLATLQTGQIAYNMFGLMALVMGAFIILNSFRTSIAERRRDIGLLRAVGASERTVLSIVIAEASLMGAGGTAIGVVGGVLLAFGILSVFRPIMLRVVQIEVGNPVFDPAVVAFAVVIGVGATLLGALLPALEARRLTPLEALRPGGAEAERARLTTSTWIGFGLIVLSPLVFLGTGAGLWAIGLLAFFAGVVMSGPVLVRPASAALGWLAVLLFPREGYLGTRNTARQPGRAALTVTVVMFGLAVVVGMLGMVASLEGGFLGYLDRSLGADYLFIPRSLVLGGGNVGSGPGLLNAVKASSGIDVATSLRVANAEAEGVAIQMIGVDPELYPKVGGLVFTSGQPDEAWKALADGRSMIVNSVYSQQHGVKKGDYVTVQTANGERIYRVAAVGLDYINAKLATAFISQRNLEEDFNQTSDVLILANRRDAADPSRTRLQLRKLVSRFPAFSLYTFDELRAEQSQVFAQSLIFFWVLIGALAIPSLLALVNTLAMNVLERTRELGVLRAVGATRGQVASLVVAEAMVLSLIGTVLGLLAGVWLAYVFVGALSATGFPLPYVFPWTGLVAGAVVGVSFALLASVLPAWRAARLDVVQALAWE